LILFHTISNWIWLSKNVMTRGWDRAGALINSLYYHDTLSQISSQTMFKALTQDQIRPPLFGLSMALMYQPFGLSRDVAVMVNAVYLVLLVLACYGIGRRLGGKWLGLLAAALVSLIPLVFAMSRYPYFEFSLTAFTMLSIYLMLATERFEKRSYSVLLGVSLGLGLLVKRTYPVFLIGAIGVVGLQAGLPRRVWQQLRSLRLHINWRHLGLAIVGGGLLSTLWYLPNQELAGTLPAGIWMLPVWWLLATATILVLLQPSSVLTNFVSSGALALSIASLWYLPHSDFVQRALRAGWGVNDPRGRGIDLLSLTTYTDYFKSILYGFSPVFSGLLVLSVILLLVYIIHRKQRFLPDPWWDWTWWPILGALVTAYLVLSTSIYKEHRAITPLLPYLGVALAGILLRLPWQHLRRALIILAVGFGFVQYFAISFSEGSFLVEKTNLAKPLLGQPGLFAQGTYLERPDSGLNDPDYYMASDVLWHVEDTRRNLGYDSISLAVIAGSSHVHVGMFVLEQLLGYPNVLVENPVQVYPEESGYSMAFRYDYVLVLSAGSRGAAVREASALILDERRSIFDQAFDLEKTYTLPDGAEVYLFHRKFPSGTSPGDDSLHSAAEYLANEAGKEDRIIVYPPDLINALLEHYWGPTAIVAADELPTDLDQTGRVFVVALDGEELNAWKAQGLPALAKSQDQKFGEIRIMTLDSNSP
jgi:hypothetical protein